MEDVFEAALAERPASPKDTTGNVWTSAHGRYKKAENFPAVRPTPIGQGHHREGGDGFAWPENVCAPTLASLETNFGLSSMLGKSLGIVGDARLGGRADQAAITERLLSISGEDGITIDRKYKEPVTVQLAIRFLILSNELPRLNDASRALASRFIMLKLKESFLGKEVEELIGKLLAELPGILNWAICGWRRLQKRGRFVQPKSSRQDIAELEFLSSPVTAFLADRCELKPAVYEPSASVFAAWQIWRESQGRNFSGNAQSFGRDLKAAAPSVETGKKGKKGAQIRVYKGIRLLP